MQTFNCLKHNKPICIADLTLNSFICERCALFDPAHKSHAFLQADKLKNHAQSRYQQLRKGLQSLNIDYCQKNGLKCIDLQEITAAKQQQKLNSLNKIYDEMVAEIQAERRSKLQQIKADILKIRRQNSQSLTTLVKQRFESLKKIAQNVDEYFVKGDFFGVLSAISENNPFKSIQSLQKDLCVMQIDLKQKIQNVGSSSLLLPLNKRKSSQKQELLITVQPEPSLFDISLSQQSFETVSCASVFGTSNTLKADSQSSRTKNDENDLSFSLQQPNKKVKTIKFKSELKDLFVKNTIRNVVIQKLGLSNRQALQAIRKCTLNSFVNKIDLSFNELNSQFLLMLKRQKIQSKYLKTIVVKGAQLDFKVLGKEGIHSGASKNNKLQLGDLTIQL